MPTYQNVVPPFSIAQGDTATVINNENPQPALPYKSAQVALTTGLRINAQRLSAEVTFAAAPGAFSFQLQAADTDTDASYSPEGSAVHRAHRHKCGQNRTKQRRGEVCPHLFQLADQQRSGNSQAELLTRSQREQGANE